MFFINFIVKRLLRNHNLRIHLFIKLRTYLGDCTVHVKIKTLTIGVL